MEIGDVVEAVIIASKRRRQRESSSCQMSHTLRSDMRATLQKCFMLLVALHADLLQWSCTVVTKDKGVAIGCFDIFWLYRLDLYAVNAALRLLRSARSSDKVILHHRLYIHSMSLTLKLFLASDSSTIVSFTFYLRSSLIHAVSSCHYRLING